MKIGGITSFDNLSFIETSLTEDGNWQEAMKYCKYVLSVASPVFFEVPKDENEMIRPAVEGIVRVLKAARDMSFYMGQKELCIIMMETKVILSEPENIVL